MIKKMDGHPKVGNIACIGDRRECDTEVVMQVSAKVIDEVVIRQDKYLRGFTTEDIQSMLLAVMRKHDPDKKG